MFRIGDRIKSEKEEFVISDMGFEVGEESGCWEAYAELEQLPMNSKHKYPVWMVLEMLKDMLLFKPGDEEMATKYRAIIEEKKAKGQKRYSEMMKHFGLLKTS